VKVSAFTIVDAYEGNLAASGDRYADVVRLAEAVEAGGLSTLWVAEHHFQPGGVCPAPPVLLAACGARTRRIRLGVMVSVLPFHRPIELAEEYALVDRLTGGRLNLGVGSGYLALEFEGFGVDPATKRERFDRNLETLLAAFDGREVRSDEPGAAPVRLNVLPIQRPHPPLWIAVQRREAIPFVARRGASLALVPYATVTNLAELGDQIREFRAQLPGGSTAEVAVAVHLYAGDRPAEARAALQRYLNARLATQSTFFQEKVRKDPHVASAATIEEGGFALIGTAATVVAGLRRYAELGVDEVLGIFDFGSLPPGEAIGSVKEIGAELARIGGIQR
jgi:alkanesulfonate monooxygenase SsuD/methylene tetrahydromethanopterin reductase-like flavin-dependent oxidoreductase (luciferase family)